MTLSNFTNGSQICRQLIQSVGKIAFAPYDGHFQDDGGHFQDDKQWKREALKEMHWRMVKTFSLVFLDELKLHILQVAQQIHSFTEFEWILH